MFAPALRELLGDLDTELFAISARCRDGIAALLARLRRLAADERQTLLLQSVARLASGMAVETAQAARFESRAIELPLDELDTRVDMFERRIIDLTSASAEAGDLLEQGVGRALAQVVNEPLARYTQLEEDRLRRELRIHVDRLAKVSPRELSDELDGWIDTTIRAEFERLVRRFETAIAEQLTSSSGATRSAIERIIERDPAGGRGRVRHPRERRLARHGAAGPSRFSFKLKDVEHALDMLVGFGRTITPGALGPQARDP